MGFRTVLSILFGSSAKGKKTPVSQISPPRIPGQFDFSDPARLDIRQFPIHKNYSGDTYEELERKVLLARSGRPDDLFNLGRSIYALTSLYLAGTGVNETTQRQAMDLFGIAAAQGHKLAKTNLAALQKRPALEPPYVQITKCQLSEP